MAQPSSTPAPPLGPIIESLFTSDIEADAGKYASTAVIKDCELVASYNWLDKKEPTILVPGS